MIAELGERVIDPFTRDPLFVVESCVPRMCLAPLGTCVTVAYVVRRFSATNARSNVRVHTPGSPCCRDTRLMYVVPVGLSTINMTLIVL